MNYLFVTDYKTTETGKVLIKRLEDEMSKKGECCTSVMLEKKDTFTLSQPFFLDCPADVIITADMAGVLTIDKQGETLYNTMYSKCFHILTREPWQYHVGLVRRMSFNSYVVTAHPWEKEFVERHYENVPNALVLPALVPTRQKRLEDSAVIKKKLDRLPKVFAAMAVQIIKDWKPGSILPKEIEDYLERNHVSFQEEELQGLTVMFKDVPDYFKPMIGEGEASLQCSEELITAIISLILAG